MIEHLVGQFRNDIRRKPCVEPRAGNDENDGNMPMSELSSAGLMKQWGAVLSVADASPTDSTGLPCCILRPPWRISKEAPSAVSAASLDPAAADFGIRFAERFVAARRQGLIPRRSGRGLLRQLQHPRADLKWIRHAIRYLGRTKGRSGTESSRLSLPQGAVAGAIAINRDPRQRALLRRLWVSRGAKPDLVAWVLEQEVAAVAAWRALFFDIGDRAKEPFRLFAALKLAEEELKNGVASGLPPLAECAGLEFGMAALCCGLIMEGGGPTANSLLPAGDAAECMDFLRVRRALLLNPDALPLDGKWVGEAIRKYNQVHAELRAEEGGAIFDMGPYDLPGYRGSGNYCEAEEDPEAATEVEVATEAEAETEAKPDPWLAPDRLPLEDLRVMAGLWCQCAPARQKVLRSASLQPPWQKSKESAPTPAAGGLPDEMSRPDFGNLLAIRVAAAGRSGELPAGGSYHWIRLMAAALEPVEPVAEGGMADVDDAALRRAVELHASENSRQLLQAALMTRDAEIGNVAQWLGLDPRVVDAYAMLFFNLPARRWDPRYRSRIEAWIKDGRNPLDGGNLPPGRGLTDEMRAAANITLDDLRRLLGFHAVDDRAVDAADRLLELLCRVAQRGQIQGEGRHQKWGTGSGSPSHQLGKTQFQNAVKLAAERINAADLGRASILQDAGVDVQREWKKAARESQREVAKLIMEDEGFALEVAPPQGWDETTELGGSLESGESSSAKT